MTDAARAHLLALVERLRDHPGTFIIGYGYMFTDNFVKEIADELAALLPPVGQPQEILNEDHPRMAKPANPDLPLTATALGDPPPSEREQLRKHIAAIDGRRPQDGHSERGFSTCPHPDCAAFRPQSMADAAEMLWVVLANVSGGDWKQQSQEWQDAAARWRDNYFLAVKAESLPAEAPVGQEAPPP